MALISYLSKRDVFLYHYQTIIIEKGLKKMCPCQFEKFAMKTGKFIIIHILNIINFFKNIEIMSSSIREYYSDHFATKMV